MELLRDLAALKRQDPLARDRVEGWRIRAGRYHSDAAPAFDELKILDAKRSVAELALHGDYSAPQPVRRHAGIRQPLDCPERRQVAEVIEVLAPANSWTHEPKSFPVPQAAVVNAHNSPCFVSRVAFAQRILFAGLTWQRCIPRIIHRLSMFWVWNRDSSWNSQAPLHDRQ